MVWVGGNGMVGGYSVWGYGVEGYSVWGGYGVCQGGVWCVCV